MNRRIALHFLATACSVVALTVSFTSLAQAQETLLQSYEVELIIFRVNHPNASPENWALGGAAVKPAAAQADDERPAVTGNPAAPPPEVATPATDTSFPALGSAQFRMNGIEESLRKSRAYQPLAHIGWIQP